MEKKLYEIIGEETGASVVMDGVTLRFRVFTIGDLAFLQSKGIDLQKLSTSTNTLEVSTSLIEAIFNQLDSASQEQFKGLTRFKQCMTLDRVNILMTGYFSTIGKEDSNKELATGESEEKK